MSVKALLWAVNQRPQTIGAKALLDVLASLANDNAQAWPTREYLAKRLPASERSISAYFGELEGIGLIEKCDRVESFRRHDGLTVAAFTPKSNVWRMRIDRVGAQILQGSSAESSPTLLADSSPYKEDSPYKEEREELASLVCVGEQGNLVNLVKPTSQQDQLSRLADAGVLLEARLPKTLPLADIVDSYRSVLPTGAPVKELDYRRVESIKRVWAKLGATMSAWEEYLLRIQASDWLTGRKPDKYGAPFGRLSLAYITTNSNYIDIIEGYHDNRNGNQIGVNSGTIQERASKLAGMLV